MSGLEELSFMDEPLTYEDIIKPRNHEFLDDEIRANRGGLPRLIYEQIAQMNDDLECRLIVSPEAQQYLVSKIRKRSFDERGNVDWQEYNRSLYQFFAFVHRTLRDDPTTIPETRGTVTLDETEAKKMFSYWTIEKEVNH